MSAAVLAVACNAEVKKSSTPVVEGDRIVLVTPPVKEGLTVNEVLSLRSSSREYTSEPLTLEELSGVMWAAAGVNPRRRQADRPLGTGPLSGEGLRFPARRRVSVRFGRTLTRTGGGR